MKLILHLKSLFALAIFSLGFGSLAFGQTATAINGLYYTGVDNSGAVLAGGAQDSHWTVSYARVGGDTYTGNSTYTGSAYVVSSNYIDAAYVPNTSTSKWITAPGARTSANGTANQGGVYLPGNGTTGDNSAYFVYRLAFTIAGSGAAGSAVSNQVSISLTIAADDQYSVYVNPAAAPTYAWNGNIGAGGTPSSSGWVTTAWDNTSAVVLQDNFGANNAQFVIGTNYLYVVVANTNSLTGNRPETARNPSGLLVYQVYGDMTIDGRVVPEVGTWLPVVLALGLFVRKRYFGQKVTAV